MSSNDSAAPVLISFSHSSQGSRSNVRPLTGGSAPSKAARAPHRIHLTRREFEVLELLAEGLPNKLISRRLEISPSTVKCHMASILRELGVTSRLQAVVAAYQYGLLDPLQDASERASKAARER
jgi:DNA-binding NarL/FixJ family response regulator